MGRGENVSAAFPVFAADEDKAIHRPCHRDVEDSHFLGQRLSAVSFFDYLVSQRVEAGVAFGIDDLQAEGQLFIDEAILC